MKVLSNAVFVSSVEVSGHKAGKNFTIGFLGNISVKKGIFDVLSVFERLQKSGIPVTGRIAGPFVNRRVAAAVMRRVSRLSGMRYVGPRYGEESRSK